MYPHSSSATQYNYVYLKKSLASLLCASSMRENTPQRIRRCLRNVWLRSQHSRKQHALLLLTRSKQSPGLPDLGCKVYHWYTAGTTYSETYSFGCISMEHLHRTFLSTQKMCSGCCTLLLKPSMRCSLHWIVRGGMQHLKSTSWRRSIHRFQPQLGDGC